MAEIIQNEGVVPQRGKRRAKRPPAHIDMTPMVDLACLLLTFFMLTTAFIKPKVMEIVMPREGQQPIKKSRVLNIILAENNQIFFYNGLADPSEGSLPTIIKSDFSEKGIRKVLMERNKVLFNSIYYMNDSLMRDLGEYNKTTSKATVEKRMKKMKSDDKTGPIVLIKVDEGVKYGNLVNILDEMAITNVARYAVVDMNTVEMKMLKDALSGINTELQN